MRALLDANANTEATESRKFYTPLLVAPDLGYLPIVRARLEAKADIEAKTLRRKTPLELAALRGSLECVRALLEAGATIGPDSMHWLSPYSRNTAVLRYLNRSQRRGAAQ